MSFSALVSGLVDSAFGIVGDLAKQVTYVSNGGQTYDVESGKMVESTTSIPAVRCVATKFKSDEKDDQVAVLTDLKALIPASDLPGIEPKVDDEIVFANGSEWDVRRVLGVPGDSLHILHIRRK